MHVKTHVTVRARDADLIVAGLRRAGVDVTDTGDRITTEDGLDGEFVLALSIPTKAETGAVEEVPVPR